MLLEDATLERVSCSENSRKWLTENILNKADLTEMILHYRNTFSQSGFSNLLSTISPEKTWLAGKHPRQIYHFYLGMFKYTLIYSKLLQKKIASKKLDRKVGF